MPRQNLRIRSNILMTPGPTSVLADIWDATTEPMINHRSPDFAQLMFSTTQILKEVYETREDVFILTASGTGALEAALANTLSPGDKVLALTNGVFGDQFAECAEAYLLKVFRISSQWGTAIDPDVVQDFLQKNKGIKAVLVVHNETSTGVINDLASIARVIKKYSNALIIVDAVSSLGCALIRPDELGLDVVCACSQKGLAIPPGLSTISFSKDAWQASNTAKSVRFYFDLRKTKKYLLTGHTPWTPNIGYIRGLNVALRKILDEGLKEVFARHVDIARHTREAVQELGLELLVKDERCASPSVTAVRLPKGMDWPTLTSLCRAKNVELGGGLGPLEGEIFRIGHLGNDRKTEIDFTIKVLKRVISATKVLVS